MPSDILKDHKRIGKVLVPPIVHKLGPMRDVSWIKQMIPELCWIGLVHEAHGDRRAVQLITALAQATRAASRESTEAFATCSSYAVLSEPAGAVVRGALQEGGVLSQLQSALIPLAGNYPGCALTRLFETEPASGDVSTVRAVLDRLLDRTGRFATLVQATAVWLMFDAQILKVAEGLALASFPKIEEYPSTELSRQIGSSIRATLNVAFGEGGPLHVAADWANRFWNRGWAMEPCEVGN